MKTIEELEVLEIINDIDELISVCASDDEDELYNIKHKLLKYQSLLEEREEEITSLKRRAYYSGYNRGHKDGRNGLYMSNIHSRYRDYLNQKEYENQCGNAC